MAAGPAAPSTVASDAVHFSDELHGVTWWRLNTAENKLNKKNNECIKLQGRQLVKAGAWGGSRTGLKRPNREKEIEVACSVPGQRIQALAVTRSATSNRR